MSSSSAPTEVRIAAQQWFARLLAPDCSDSERMAFDRWRAADPAHDEAYSEVERIWERSVGLRRDPDIAAALQDAMRPALPPRKSKSGHRLRWRPALAIAALVALTVSAWLWTFAPRNVAAVRYATVLGQQRTVTLKDGSVVVLDTDTVLLVSFSQRDRSLTLRKGQADFRVKHNPDRPFVVHTGTGAVTATGTHFQIRVGDNGSTVTLLKGQVLVTTAAHPHKAILKPGERIVIGPSGQLGPLRMASKSELASVRGWTDGNLVVKGWPLHAVVAEMNRYSTTKLRLGDPALRNIPISGVFKAGDQKSLVLALEYGWHIHANSQAVAGEIILTH